MVHSDYDSESSCSPCSTNDGLDLLSIDAPQMFFPQDFDLSSVQAGLIPDADQSFCSLDEHLDSIIEANEGTNHLEEYIKACPPPACVMPRQLPSCSLQANMPQSLNAHHGELNLNVQGMDGGLIPTNHETLPTNPRINNTNNEEGNSKLSRNNPLPYANDKSKKTRPAFKTLRKHTIPDQMKDEKYWRRRLRNNWSAKKSREAKRVKDRLIHDKISFLEDENNKLKMIIARLLAEKNSQQYVTAQWNNQIM